MIVGTFKPIFLIGFMASGKTTLGRALQVALPGINFVDLDEAIENVAGCSVAEIFNSKGEEAFRQLESDTLRRVANHGTIIACGGGTPCRQENLDFMRSKGRIVRLEASSETIVRRLLEANPDQRPLVKAYMHDPEALVRKVDEMIASRKVYYDSASDSLDANELDTLEQVERSVAKFISQFNLTQ